MNYAIRSGISITAGYAIRQSTRLLHSVKGHERDEIAALQQRLESKIRIISPAIDMIELISARGNTTLDSAVSLTKAIRLGIQALGVRLSKAAADEELYRKGSSRAKSEAQAIVELKAIIVDMKRLLSRIEDAVPLINLAITTSGVNLSTQLPSSVSPSRLLQASTFLTAGDSRYAMAPGNAVQIGSVFVLSLYMLFAGHANRPHDEEGIRETTWKEVIHKGRVKLMRVPLDKLYELPLGPEELGRSVNGVPSNVEGDYFPPTVPSEGKAYEFAYQLLVVEDLEDDRVHEFEGGQPQPGPFEDVSLAGIREIIPIHEISKIFYADTGKILNIGTDGETNNPILLLKRDVNATPPRRMAEVDEEEAASGSGDEDDAETQLLRESAAVMPNRRRHRSDSWHLPHDLDPEWLAFEVYTEEPDSDDEETESSLNHTSTPPVPSRSGSLAPLTSMLSRLNVNSSPPAAMSNPNSPQPQISSQMIPAPGLTSPIPMTTPGQPTTLPPLRTSLSLLEVLIRLTSLQQFQQASHLTISDELLNFFLSEAATTGAGADSEYRRRARDHARRRVGFDPYDESPIKRRGEEYIDHYGETHPGWDGAEDYEESPYPQHGSRGATPGVRSTRTSTSARSTPYGVSPPPMSSPSPSLKTVQERTAKTKSASDVHNAQRDSGFVGLSTPPLPSTSAKGRMEALRSDAAGDKRSPLSQSESDSTLGTSPSFE